MAKRKKRIRRGKGPTGEQAIKNAVEKGLITQEQVKEYRKEKSEKAKLKNKKLKKKRPKPVIIYGLNTNSM